MAGRKPGRESAAAAEVRTQVATLVPRTRLEAPDTLNEAQKRYFDTAVGSMPKDWFKAADVAMLVAYARHAAAADKIAAQIAVDEQKNHIAMLDPLYRMQEREFRSMAAAATKLRLTPQTQYQAKKSRNGPTGLDAPKPWER